MSGFVRFLLVLLVVASTGASAGGQADSATTTGRPSGPLSRADSILEAQTTVLASELRCPVCQGNSIQDSPSELALQMRDVIRDQLRSGKTPDDVRAYFVAKYGEWILLSPRAEGINLVVYLVPFAVLLIGGLVVWRTIRRWTGGPPASPLDSAEGG